MITAHPSRVIKKNSVETIRALSAKAEQLGTLHAGQLKIIYSQKWFRLFVPKKYNGLELSLPQGLKTEEAMAWADGSTGWTVTLCAGANWFAGFLQPSLLKKIFNNNKVCLAGSGRASGIARITKKGYKITGSWKYATGAPHATAFTANCLIEKDGMLLKDKEGNNVVEAFLFLRKEVAIIEEWYSMGMIATASYTFEVNELPVDKSRCFTIDPAEALLPNNIYQYPFLQFAETTLAVNISGMAIHYLDLCKILFKEKKKEFLPLAFEKENQHEKIRSLFYKTVERSWKECVSKRSVTKSQLKKVTTVSRKLAFTSGQLVEELYPFCGLEAADTRTEMNRIWRDLHTASQHTLLIYHTIDASKNSG
jgi:indole-3-acetate monooxygenase